MTATCEVAPKPAGRAVRARPSNRLVVTPAVAGGGGPERPAGGIETGLELAVFRSKGR